MRRVRLAHAMIRLFMQRGRRSDRLVSTSSAKASDGTKCFSVLLSASDGNFHLLNGLACDSVARRLPI